MLNVAKTVATLEQMSVGELRGKYAELFQETTRAFNRRWLIRRIAWRMQSIEGGGLSELARQRAEELASTSDLRVTAPRAPQSSADTSHRTKSIAYNGTASSALPLPGTIVTRHYKGRLIQVRVMAAGFEFEGELYKSLSAVAKKVTGTHWNGPRFFNLQGEGGNR